MNSNEPCGACVDGTMRTYCTKRVGHTDLAKRYLRCDLCGATDVEVTHVPRRRPTGLLNKVNSTLGQIATPASNAVMANSIPDHSRLHPMTAKVSPLEFQAEWLCLSTRKLLQWIASGICPAPQIIDAYARWLRVDLDEWETARFPKSAPPTEAEMRQIRLAVISEELARQEELRAAAASRRVPPPPPHDFSMEGQA